MVRRLLLAPILVPVAVGGLRLALRGAGVDSELIGWVFGLAYFVVFTSLFWWVAATVFRAEGGRARAEAGLREANAQLAAANQELEAFSYSVSHDLRAPLRSIDGFSRILLEDFAGSLPDEAKEYLQDVRASARHMGQLVDDLLAFARLSRQPIRAQQVRTGEVVRQCLEELRAEREGRQVELVVADLPPCTGDAALLKQVWVNLLANALKYSRKAAAARVEVGFSTAGEAGEVTYFVRDNGVGFDMRYAHKLFGVFQRLHRAEEFEGTGVGLAIVQRVVHRHGGRVWADARPGEGATFFFTLRGVGGGQ
ncbi:two-component sensor histidine kinase [bacterium]|nr:two-component sensor histidine kinase [bacterium]